MGTTALFQKKNYKVRICIGQYANWMTLLLLVLLDTGGFYRIISTCAIPTECCDRINVVDNPGPMAETGKSVQFSFMFTSVTFAFMCDSES